MNNKLHYLSKKDKGIALIFSLFFFVIFFVFGTALLFRSSLNKKTSNALSNSQVNNASLEGVIGSVRANLVMANLNTNGTSKSSGTSLTFEGKMTKSTLSSSRSPVYTISSLSAESTNGTENNIVSGTTPELFKFNFNGLELDGIDSSLTGAPSPEWAIHYSDPSKSAGTGAVRYSYLIIDQTGKVNPNYAGNSGHEGDYRIGFDTEIFKEAQSVDTTKTSSIYDMSGIFTNINRKDLAITPLTLNRFNSLTQISNLLNDNNGPYASASLSDFSTTSGIEVFDESDNEISMSSELLAHELLYPFTHPVTYAEKSNIFNLAYLDSSTFQAYSNERKIETLIGNSDSHPLDKYTGSAGAISYLTYFPSEKFDDEGDDDDGDGNNYDLQEIKDQRNKIVSQKEQIAASLIDLVDDNIITTTNYGFYGNTSDPDYPAPSADLVGKPWSFVDWVKFSKGKPYSGFEGIFTSALNIQFKGYADDPAKNSGNLLRKRMWIVTAPEVACAYDLQGSTIESILAKASDPASPNYKYRNARIMIYNRFKISFKIAKRDRTTGVWQLNWKQYQDQKVQLVAPLPYIQELGTIDYKNIPIKGKNKQRNFYAYYNAGSDYNDTYFAKYNLKSGGDWYANWGALIYSWYKEDSAIGGGGRSEAIHYNSTYDAAGNPDPNSDYLTPYALKIEMDSPTIIFADIDTGVAGAYNSTPDSDEIINISSPQMPSQSEENPTDPAALTDDMHDEHDFYRGFTDKQFSSTAPPALLATNVYENQSVITAVMTGDPRLSFLPSSSNTLGDGWFNVKHNKVYTKYNGFNEHLYTDHFGKFTGLDAAAGDSSLQYPTEEELKFTFPKMDNEVVLPKTIIDHEEKPLLSTIDTIISSRDINNYTANRQIYYDNGTLTDTHGLKSLSSFSMPMRFSTNTDGTFKEFTGFGGITQTADIGKICRGEHWRTLNICQYNIGLLENPTDSSQYTYAGVKGGYTGDFDNASSKQFPFNREELSGEVDDLITNYSTDSTDVGTLLNGGDAAILDQVGFSEGDNNGNGTDDKEESLIILPKKTIYGTFNPNTAYPLAFQSVISGIKINRQEFSSKTYLQGQIDDPSNPALPLWKSSALASKFYKLVTDNLNGSNKLAPFDRKYSFSNTLDKSPGDLSYQEGFNVSTTYDSITRSYTNGDQRAGSMRWGNVFANKENYFLSDQERELLYTNTREFISVRYNYYSAIILVEPLKIVPDSATGDRIVTINNSGDKAKVDSHYRVRAELAHDILTNEVKILNYSILN